MPAATAKPGAPGQGFASAMSPWQPRPFTSPFAQASSMGPSQQGPPLGSRPRPLAPPLGAPPRPIGAPTPRPRPGPGGVSMPAPKPIGVPVTGPNGVQAPGMQMDGLTPQAFPRPSVMPNGGPGVPTPGIAPGLEVDLSVDRSLPYGTDAAGNKTREYFQSSGANVTAWAKQARAAGKFVAPTPGEDPYDVYLANEAIRKARAGAGRT
jgi:hypothetical protein